MKVIFDFGSNKGQNLSYFLDKADMVVAVEANKSLIKQINLDFKQFIDNKKLILENVALTNDENVKNIDFYISKTNDVLSTLYPSDINKFYKQKVKSKKASFLINEYLEKYNIKEIEYIKIDLEGGDQIVLDDLLTNNILPNYLSIECGYTKILELLLSSSYKSFKFIDGEDKTSKQNIEYTTKNNIQKIIDFDFHSSGPYGDDIPGNYFTKNSILPYFLNKGLGWKDIHCSLQEKRNLSKIEYIYKNTGFLYHLKNLLPSFFKALIKKIKIFKKN